MAKRFFLICALIGSLLPSAVAQTATPPYHAQMARLAEVLGGLHYIRPLCGYDEAAKWRNRMVELLQAEKPDSLREVDMIEHFNRSYETLKATHASCTAATRAIMEDYLQEGAELAASTRARFAE